MLTIIVADNKIFRAARVSALMAEYAPTEIIMLDDSVTTVADIEQYLYPSLFMIGAPMVHLRFILDAKEKELTAVLLKKIIASPTIFLFEELALSKPFITALKKQGAIVHADETKKAAKENNMFAVTGLVTIASKKDRWLAYQKAVAQYPIEGILGLLYWKVRDLALKERSDSGQYHLLYTALLEAHAKAWQEGTPLTLAVEKTLLLY